MNEEATVVCAFCGLAPYKEFHGATRLHWTRNDCIAALRSALAEAKLNAGNFAVIQPGQSVACHRLVGATTYKTFVMPDGKTYQTMTGNGGGSWRVVETSGRSEG